MADGYNPANYEASRRTVEYDYGRNSANNAYGRFLSQQRGSRQLSDMSRGFERGYPGLQANLNRRGVSGAGINSGIETGAMQRYLGDFTRNYGRAQVDFDQEQQQYDIGQQLLDQWRQGALADLGLNEQNDISAAASNIEALRAYLGGL